MREVLGERLGHGRADAGPAARARPRPGRADLALLAVAALILAVGLSVAVALVLLAGDLRRFRRPRQAAACEPWPFATPGSRGRPAGGSTTTTSTRSCWGWCWSGPRDAPSRRTSPSGSGGRWAWRPTLLEPGQPPLQAGLNGRAVDFAKLGALYLHGGVWRGRQLVPRRWVADSTRADTRTDPSPRFQYDWWTRPGTGPGNDFWAQGNHGQFVYVAPSRDVVLVRFGTGYHDDHWPDLLATLARRL